MQLNVFLENKKMKTKKQCGICGGVRHILFYGLQPIIRL